MNTLTDTKNPTLERRVASLVCDALIFTACCGVLVLYYVKFLATVPAWLVGAAGGVLIVMFVTEAVAGLTPGRLLTHVRVVRDDGSPAPLPTLITRAAFKWVPLFLFACGLLTSSPLADLFWWTAAIVVQVYATIYYFATARRDRSAFDLPVKTRIVLAQS